MKIFSVHNTPRLSYMANWLSEKLGLQSVDIVTNAAQLGQSDFVINYSQVELPVRAFVIRPQGLLFETALQNQDIEITTRKGLPIFFANQSPSLGFDMLAASFYLISRYEEYLPHQLDEYGRYSHKNSLAYQHEFLKIPLVDYWLQWLRAELAQFFPNLVIEAPAFVFTPTYDIDLAFRLRGKSVLHQLAVIARAIFHLQFETLAYQFGVLIGRFPDEFDIFPDLEELHQQQGLQAHYFVLAAQNRQGYDKNMAPQRKKFRELLHSLPAQRIGMHLSFAASQQPKIMQIEQNFFVANGHAMAAKQNRMHYLQMWLPNTYLQLQQLRIPVQAEFSMGYGDINGFRASTSQPFYWYNLGLEQPTGLRIHPFCWMDANSIFEQKDSPELAQQELQELIARVKQTGGACVTIAHNHLMGFSKLGRKWWHIYKQVLLEQGKYEGN